MLQGEFTKVKNESIIDITNKLGTTIAHWFPPWVHQNSDKEQ